MDESKIFLEVLQLSGTLRGIKFSDQVLIGVLSMRELLSELRTINFILEGYLE